MTLEEQLASAMNEHVEDSLSPAQLTQAWDEHMALTGTGSGARTHRWRTPALIAAVVVAISAIGAATVADHHRSVPTATSGGTVAVAATQRPATSPAATHLPVSSAATTIPKSAFSTCAPENSMIVGAEPIPAVSDFRPGSAQTLVPDTPTSAMICRYYGGNTAHPGNLAASRSLTAGKAQGLAALFNSGTQGTGVLNCPADYNNITLVTFGYAQGLNVQVTYDSTGCQIATNGLTSVMTITLQDQLTALLP